MILTCPACSAKYKLADTAIPAQGRKVRCAACGHSWHQLPEGGAAAAVARARGGGGGDAQVGAAAAAEAALRPGPSAGDSAVLERRGRNERRRITLAGLLPFRRAGAVRPERRQQRRRKLPPPVAVAARNKVQGRVRLINGAAAAGAWAVSLLAAAGIVWTGVHHRAELVKIWPQSATLFAAIGLPANLYGIDIARVQVRDGVDARGQRIIVAGVLRGVGQGPVAVPYLKVALLDRQGVEKASWLVDPGISVLQPGQAQAFETQRRNPPRGQLTAVVAFAEPPPAAPRRPPPPPEPPSGTSGLMGALPPGETAGSGAPPPVTAR